MGARAKVPGPRSLNPLGELLPFRRNSIGTLERLVNEHGDVVFFRIGHIRACLLNHPDFVKEVLVTHQKKFSKGRPLEMARRLLGEGLLTADGERHLSHRRMIQPMFHRARLPGYASVMVEAAESTAKRWKDDEVRDVSLEMADMALVISGRAMFNVDVTHEAREIGAALMTAMSLFSRVSLPKSELLLSLPLPSTRRFEQAKARLDRTIFRMIDQRKAEGVDKGDLLSLLLGLHEPGTSPMSDQEIRDEALIFFLAAFDTTALTLTWAWYLLSCNPEAEAKVHAELAAVLGGRRPGPEDLDQLPYTQQVVAEVLRLYPPGYLLARNALESLEVGGYEIPAGTLVLVSPYLIHRDARFYDDPELFRPERWLGVDPHHMQPKFAYFPFGGGPRLCIGDAFAWMEATLVIATMAQQWKFRLDPGHVVELRPLLNLRPKFGMRMRLERRHSVVPA